MIEQRDASYLSAWITGLANFSVQYNFQNIGLALLMMSQSECTTDDGDCKQGIQVAWVHGSSSAVIFGGAILGQLCLGYLGDVVGRNHALMLTMLIAAASALLSAVVPYGGAVDVYAAIIAIRFFLGVGLGGIFPLSATKASEDGSAINDHQQHHDGDKVNPVAAAYTYFWQMPGIMAPYIVTLIIYDDNPSSSSSRSWRILLGTGAIPSFLSLIGLIIEKYMYSSSSSYKNKDDNNVIINDMISNPISSSSPRDIIDDEHHHISSSTSSSSPEHDIAYDDDDDDVSHPSLWTSRRYRSYMIASGGTWLLFDIVAFGVSLSGSDIIATISNTDDNISASKNIREIASKQLIATSLGVIGTMLAVYILRHVGLKKMQVSSFVFIAFCSLLFACLFQPLHSQHDALFVLYCLLNLAIQSGVNITAFALPSALYPRAVRATYNGIASALGKLGAVLGAYSFISIAESNPSGYALVMGICAIISLLGAVVSQIYIDQHKIDRSVVNYKNTSLPSSSPSSSTVIISLSPHRHKSFERIDDASAHSQQ